MIELEQEGWMRLRPGGRALPFRATASYRVGETAFLWRARFRLAPFVHLVVEDGFDGRRGSLVGRLWGVVPVVRGRTGPELDRGEALRYLAELPWLPEALAANQGLAVHAEGFDTAVVSAPVGDREASVRFRYVGGDPVEVTAIRSRQVGSRFEPTSWHGAFSDFAELDGARVPLRAEVAWDLPTGRFVYFAARVLSRRRVPAPRTAPVRRGAAATSSSGRAAASAPARAGRG